ncbi:hypothetical protein KCP73_16430 [Salmonella enterica subsp. enterica]|nr:hypothetical protein KCP73_16430 [Salmonella enterica subsp. enterica]
MTDGWNFLISRLHCIQPRRGRAAAGYSGGILQSMQQQHTALPEALSQRVTGRRRSLMTTGRMARLGCNRLNAMIDKGVSARRYAALQCAYKISTACAVWN